MILPRLRQITVRLQKKRREPFTRSAFSTERSSWPWSLTETAFSIAWSECLPAHSFVLLHDERISAGLRSCSPPGEKARQTALPQPEDSIWSALNTSDCVEICRVHRASNAEKQPTGPGPKGCDENGPAAAVLVRHVSVQICSLLPPVGLGPPCRRPILIGAGRCSSSIRCGSRRRSHQNCLHYPGVFDRHIAGALDFCRLGRIRVCIHRQTRVTEP